MGVGVGTTPDADAAPCPPELSVYAPKSMTMPDGVGEGVTAGNEVFALFVPEPIIRAAGMPMMATSNVANTVKARGERLFTCTANAESMLRIRADAACIRTRVARERMRFEVMRFAFPAAPRAAADVRGGRRFVCRFM